SACAGIVDPTSMHHSTPPPIVAAEQDRRTVHQHDRGSTYFRATGIRCVTGKGPFASTAEETTVGTARLVFDGRCGFCTRAAGWLRRLDRRRRVDTVPLQAPGAPESVGSTEEECLNSLRWRGADGTLLSGAAAANAAVGTALGSRLPIRLYRLTSGTQDRVYDWVAANRHRLPGMRPHCESEPGACGE